MDGFIWRKKLKKMERMSSLSIPILPLETPRLLLRPYAEKDLLDFFTSHPQVGPAAGWTPHKNISESRKILDSFIAGGEVWAVEEKTSGHVIGSVGLHQDVVRKVNKDIVLTIGYTLSAACWGKGYATEAVRRVLRYVFSEAAEPPELISVRHYDFNNRSRRVIKKCGFKFEGVIRKAVVLPEYGLRDCWQYSMTEREWRQTVVREEAQDLGAATSPER